MMHAVSALLAVVFVGLSAWCLGRLCRQNFWSPPHPALAAAADTALGLLIVSHAVFALTLLDLASTLGFSALTAALGAVLALGFWRFDWADLRRRAGQTRWWTAPAAVIVIWTGWTLALAALPPATVDELVYHLEVPRRILDKGGSVFFVDNVYAWFPELGEKLFALGLWMGGETTAHLLHGIFGALLGLAVYGFSRRHLPRVWSLAAAGFFLTIPSVLWVASLAYVDLAFALYSFLALVFLIEYLKDRSLRWALAAGLMAGGAWAVKYTGLQLTLLLLLLLLLERLFARRKEIPWAGLLFPLVAGVVAMPYLLRNWMATGWPLFPFSVAFFELDPRLNWDLERSRLFLTWLSGFGSGLETSAAGKLLSPLLVFATARFDRPDAYDGVVGPVFLMVPFLLWGRALSRESKVVIGFIVAFLYYWSLTTQQVRFLLPVMPALAFLLAKGLAKRRSRALNVLALILVAVGFWQAAGKLVLEAPWRYWTGAENREQYLSRRVLGYGIYQQANERLGDGDRLMLVNMRNFGYFLNVDWRADFVFEYYRLGKELKRARKPDDLLPFFQKQSITHVMIDEALTLSPLALDEREQALLRGFLSARATLVARDPLLPQLSLWRIN